MLKDNIDKILSQIQNGNNLNEPITLVAATKTIDVNTINKAIEFGIKVVAENKVQEFKEKTGLLSDCEQHFIGHLQTNKVKYLVGNVALIQSVDSIHLAEEISRIATKKNVVQKVLVEVNIGGELSKSGVTPSNTIEVVNIISKMQNIKVCGLMAMLPNLNDNEKLSKLVRQMRSIYDKLKKSGYCMNYLSIGMSHDYSIAIQNGSNMIRIGSALFGERNYGDKK